MARKIADAYVRARLDTSGITRDAESSMLTHGSALGNTFGGAFTGAFGKLAVALGSVFAVGKLVSEIKGAVAAASDLGETTSAVGQIFGESKDAVVAFAQTANRELGQTRTQALNAANTFATFGKSAGLTGDSLVGFSTKMVGLTADLASFRNTSPEDAIEAVGAALRGESEPIRRYGVLLDDATLRQRALSLGIVDTTKNALTPQQRVLAAQAEILAQTSDAQGDFMRTSGGLANQQRITTALIGDFKVKVGELLLPAVQGVVSVFNNQLLPVIEDKVIPALGRLRDWFTEKVVPVIRDQLVPVFRDQVIPAVRDFGTFVQDEVLPKLEAFRAWIDEKLKPVVQDLKDHGIDPLKDSFNDLKTSVEDNKTQFQALWDLLAKIVDFIATYVMPILGPSLRGQLRATTLEFQVLFDQVGRGIGVFQWAISTLHDFVFWLRGVKDSLVSMEADAGNWLWNTGRNIVLGLWNGIRSLGGWLATNVSSFIRDNVPEPVRKLLGIGSPSRVFRQFGRDTIRGFALGVNDESTGIERAFARALPAGGFGGGGSGGGSSVSTTNVGGPVQNIFNLVGPSVAELAAQVQRQLAWSQGA